MKTGHTLCLKCLDCLIKASNSNGYIQCPFTKSLVRCENIDQVSKPNIELLKVMEAVIKESDPNFDSLKIFCTEHHS